MTSPIFNINGSGFVGASVGATESGLVGAYCDGAPYRPDESAVRALIPYRWRAAFDRNRAWWWPNETGVRPWAYRSLHDRNGKHLTTIYAHAVAQ